MALRIGIQAIARRVVDGCNAAAYESHPVMQQRWLVLAVSSLSVSLLPARVVAESELPPHVGWDSGRLETGRGAALSGAEIAKSSSLGALFSNPANMAASRIYHAGATAAIWPEAARQAYGAAVVDSHTSSTGLAGGVSGTWFMQDPNGIERTGTDVRFAIAFPFSQKFRLGAGAKYLSLRQNGHGPLGESLASSGLPKASIVRDFGIDAGATLQPIPGLAFSIVGMNLNIAHSGLLPMMAGGGVGGGNDNCTLEADVLADFSTWDRTTLRAMGSAELLLGDHFPIRAGYRFDEGAKMQWLSAGTGYTDKAMRIELGVRRSVSGPGATAIVFSLVYHVESAGLGSTTTDTY